MKRNKIIQLNVRKNLFTNRYVLFATIDNEDYDIFDFNSLSILYRVKKLIEQDMSKSDIIKN